MYLPTFLKSPLLPSTYCLCPCPQDHLQLLALVVLPCGAGEWLRAQVPTQRLERVSPGQHTVLQLALVLGLNMKLTQGGK